MEAIAKFDVNFPWIVPVESAEGNAVIEFYAPVGNVDGIQRSGKALAKIFSEGKIESCMLRQVIPGIRLSGKCIGETRPIVNVGGGVDAPRERDIAANIQRIALVVVERRETCGQGKIRESSRDRSDRKSTR